MHLPVLWKEVIDYLDPAPGNVIFDATFGGGGHAREIIKKIVPGGRLIAVDRDHEAVERAEEIGSRYKREFICVNDDFRNIDKILDKLGIEKIDGAVFDLGVSSFQIDEGHRGFSFLREGPLDMRFNTDQKLTAAEVINKFGRSELGEIIKKYGEERYAGFIAGAICAARKKRKGIETTGALVDVIRDAVGRKYRKQRLHPAARTFQAIRIYVNDELGALEEGIYKAIQYLKQNGKILVISFHSLEDRIVKNMFRDMARTDTLKVLTKKPIRPGKEEIMENPRSRSAKLRVAEKLI